MEERELRVGVAGAGFIGAVHARSARPAGAGADAAIRRDEPGDALPVFTDGMRAVRITEAVLESSATHEWVDVPALEPTEVAP